MRRMGWDGREKVKWDRKSSGTATAAATALFSLLLLLLPFSFISRPCPGHAVGRTAGNMEEEEEKEGRALTLPCAPARGVKERRMASGSGSN